MLLYGTIKIFMNIFKLITVFATIIPFLACSQVSKVKLNYLGRIPPSNEPEIFAPGLISNSNEYEFGSVFNKAVTEFYYGVDVGGRSEIRYSELINDNWTDPKVILEHGIYDFNDPFLSPNEDRLYFISNKALEGEGKKQDHDIWYVKRESNGKWSEPINSGSNINTIYNEYYMSFTKSGTMYFSSDKKVSDSSDVNFDIYYSEFLNGEFQEAKVLSKSINTNYYEADVFIDPQESYMIFCAIRPEGLGRGDLYISFKNDDGSWSKSTNMGDAINTNNHELCPFVSHDGLYFFYTSNKDIYWVSTNIFNTLKNNAN